MKKPITILLVSAILLSGCSRVRESRMNPFNWFGQGERRQAAAVVTPAQQLAIEQGNLIAEVTDLRIDPAPGGAIVRATGLALTQGYYNAQLVAQNKGRPVDGVITYFFRAEPPDGREPVSTPQSRQIVVAKFISNSKLETIQQIQVLGAQSSLVSRR
ncbi:hypothetical protein ACFFUT_09525 [Pseudohalocynthiibacter aestuariivivens]|jgi:hypothetical protein|uniref:Lipoprotein n=1 Tax=Pseudohalocynthiibacter aestuariivivens TaxID=1591409 RepID=A0ABV5JEY1_9RHOB|nr:MULTISPECIES: hypothetical protein [Pseudohalocynthiibacter]MBS9718709.1 hypothetical protein [Pseudohalocynthiibacter aestuariivivens]MCK0104328.1 hypothetical protein [Pseudohalocynthiibacter sp. F2068]